MPTAYMDHAAATPVKKQVVEAMAPYFDQFYGNPSAVYDLGMRCKRVLEDQRAKVAGLIGARPGEIIFTSSGAEANNLAVKGTVAGQAEKRPSYCHIGHRTPLGAQFGQISGTPGLRSHVSAGGCRRTGGPPTVGRCHTAADRAGFDHARQQ